jgi:tetratricopeptide (TPR) repeat protein
MAEAQPEVLARHWTEAGETESAITEWSRAGEIARARNAFSEALGSYQQAVALMNLLPESTERDLRELELRHSVVLVSFTTRGFAAHETTDAIERAAALAEKIGNLRQLVAVMITQGFSAFFSGDLSAAGTLADRALTLALSEGSSSNLANVYFLQLVTCYYRGDFTGAEKHFTAGLVFFDDPSFRQRPATIVAAFGGASANALILGRADLARQRMAQMMAAANENNAFDVASRGLYAAQRRIAMREYKLAEALAARALELSEQHQFSNAAARSRCVLGQARAQLGHATEGVALIRQGIERLREIGTPLGISAFTAYLAEAQERAGAIVDALETVEQALQTNSDELFYRPETLRLRGELRLKQGQTELAQAGFREAILLAQKMSAKAWELRATTSLARLLRDANHRDEARAMLAEIYGWFTEGFDTADLKDAKALLNELGG